MLVACSVNAPDELIPEDTYIDLLAELHLLSALEQTYPDSTLRDDGLEQILLRYNISIETFEESHEHYLRDVDEQRRRLDEANRRLKEEFDRLNEITRELRESKRQAAEPENDTETE